VPVTVGQKLRLQHTPSKISGIGSTRRSQTTRRNLRVFFSVVISRQFQYLRM